MTNHLMSLNSLDGNTMAMVNGQDYAGGVSAYDDDVFINHVLGFQDEFGWEYAYPFEQYALNLAANYYWPKNAPLSILNNPLVNGIITGQLYDPNTPYIWSSHIFFSRVYSLPNLFSMVSTPKVHVRNTSSNTLRLV
jgi:hypothetical protein